jgi:thiamine biosynthesis lipoprotein
MREKVYRQAWGKAALFLLTACAVACRSGAAPERMSETRRLMGVPWTITLHAPSRDAGRTALAAAFAEVARLEAILSDYDPQSEVSRLSAAAPLTEPVPVGADLWRVLERSVAFRDASDGAFDPTVGPLTALWRQARRSGRLPRPEKLAAARAAVGPAALRLDHDRRAVSLPQAGTRLDLGGIGMGYAADRVLALLRGRGVAAAMVDASGDVVVSGPPPGSDGWRISVRGLTEETAAPPTLLLANAAVTTSGDAFQGVEIDGIRYSHIVDPRTGLGVTGQTAVTVLAPDGTTADALATAASVLGPQEGGRLIAKEPGCAARFVWRADGRTHESTTAAWAAHLAAVVDHTGRP